MRTLPNDRWRRFVQHLIISGGKNRLLCLRDAGFGGNDNTLHAYGCRLMLDPRIQEAIVECTRGDMALFLPAALRRLKHAVDDPQDKDGVKAAVEIMNRTGLHGVQEVKHTHALDDSARLQRLAALAKQTGLDIGSLVGDRLGAKVIDVPFEEVEEETPTFDISHLL